MLALYDISRQSRKKEEIEWDKMTVAGNPGPGRKLGINPVREGHSYDFVLSTIQNQVTYVGTFTANVAGEGSNRQNSLLAVYSGDLIKPAELWKDVSKALKSKKQVRNEPEGFLPNFTDRGQPPTKNKEMEQILSRISKNGSVEIEVESYYLAGMISAMFHELEVRKGDFYPIAVKKRESLIDDFEALREHTGGKGLHIVMDPELRNTDDEIRFIDKSKLSKAKSMLGF